METMAKCMTAYCDMIVTVVLHKHSDGGMLWIKEYCELTHMQMVTIIVKQNCQLEKRKL